MYQIKFKLESNKSAWETHLKSPNPTPIPSQPIHSCKPSTTHNRQITPPSNSQRSQKPSHRSAETPSPPISFLHSLPIQYINNLAAHRRRRHPRPSFPMATTDEVTATAAAELAPADPPAEVNPDESTPDKQAKKSKKARAPAAHPPYLDVRTQFFIHISEAFYLVRFGMFEIPMSVFVSCILLKVDTFLTYLLCMHRS